VPGPERGLLRQHDFASLWWGQLTSIIGERLSYVALLGLVAEHTHQLRDRNAPVLLAMLANVTAAPALIFSPFTGAWVDRWNLRRVLIISDTLRALLIVLVPVVYSFAHSLTSVYGVVFGLFVCNVFFLPAKSAIVPEVVPAQQLLAANVLLALSGVLGTMVAMPIGGWLVDHIGWAPVLLVNAVTYLSRW
jgi:MFS family permease